ncbi:MAG: PilZ domain-containing protein [Bacteriovoracia bacterium]
MADIKKSSIQKKSGCYLLNIKQPERTFKRLKLSFQRISVTISTLKSERKVEAAVGIVDLSETGAGFFTAELLSKGCGVEVCFTDPMILKVRAIVAWSIPIESGLQEARFPCRSGLQFMYDNEAQRHAVVDFIEKISANPMDNYRRTFSAPATGVAEPAPAATPTTAAPVDPAAAAPGEAPAPVAAETAPAVAAVPEPAPAAEAAPAPAAEATPVKTEGDGSGESQAA